MNMAFSATKTVNELVNIYKVFLSVYKPFVNETVSVYKLLVGLSMNHAVD